VDWVACDPLHLRANTFLVNVAENGETLRQDIFRTGFRLGADYQVSRRWRFDADYNSSWYSDVNYGNEFFGRAQMLLTFLPTELKQVFDLDLLSFANPTVRLNLDPNILIGDVHPYFAPQGFAYSEVRLEWLYYLSRDYFAHADVCYYGLQSGIGEDSQFHTYATLRALANWNVKPWLSVGANAQTQLANVYREFSAFVYLTARLPHFDR
jgi:hypothetical protein